MTTRALVLGGGGPLAVAWEAGLLSGFARGGVDLTRAEFVLGTSAGAIVGAHLLAGGVEAFADSIIGEAERPPAGFAPPPPEAVAKLPELFRMAQQGMGNPAEARAEIGAYALAAPTRSEDEVLAQFRSMLPPGAMPAALAVTAVDAEDGGFELITHKLTDDLARAVQASCALPGISPPATIAGRRYMDGGLRSTTNADLAVGYDLVLAVGFHPQGPSGERMAARFAQEVESLQEDAGVVSVTPDDEALEAIGSATMDATRRPAVCRAGLAQGLAQAPILKEVWG